MHCETLLLLPAKFCLCLSVMFGQESGDVRILDMNEVKYMVQNFYMEVCLKIILQLLLYFHTFSDALKFHVCLKKKKNQNTDD